MEIAKEDVLRKIKRNMLFETSDKSVFKTLELAFEYEKKLEIQKKIIKFVDLILETKPELIKEELISLLTEYEEYDPNKKDVNER